MAGCEAEEEEGGGVDPGEAGAPGCGSGGGGGGRRGGAGLGGEGRGGSVGRGCATRCSDGPRAGGIEVVAARSCEGAHDCGDASWRHECREVANARMGWPGELRGKVGMQVWALAWLACVNSWGNGKFGV